MNSVLHYCMSEHVKAVPLHATKAFWGEEVLLLLILDLGIRWWWVVSVTPRPRFSPWGKYPGTHLQEIGWAPGPVWTQRLEEKSFCLWRGSNLDRPLVKPVATHYTVWATWLTVWICSTRNFVITLAILSPKVSCQNGCVDVILKFTLFIDSTL
jgi:hypothetical protein